MNRTIGRRIATGYAIVLMLLAAVAITGVLALRSASREYQAAIASQRDVMAAALEAQTEVRDGNVAYLRYLLVPQERFAQERDLVLDRADSLLRQTRSVSPLPEDQRIWELAQRNMAEWRRLSAQSMEVR